MTAKRRSLRAVGRRSLLPRRTRGALALACTLCAGLTVCSLWAQAEESRQKLQSLQQNIASKEKAVQQQKQQRNTLLRQLKQQEQSIASAARKLRAARNALNQADKDIAALNQSITTLQQQQKAQQRLLAAQLDAAWRQGPVSPIQLLFSGEDGQRNERILAYFGYLNTSRQQVIANLRQTRQTLKQKRRTLLSKRAQQKQYLNERQLQQAAMEQAQQERKATLTQLESALREDQQQLAELRQNETALKNKIAKAERAAQERARREAEKARQIRERQREAKRHGEVYQPNATEQALIARTGGLGRPAKRTPWPVNGTLLHRFGENLQGELRWKGLVIAAPEGAEVHAIASGRVLLADWLQGYGLVVVIEHGRGDMSLYGYNQSTLVNVGDQVTAGQPIALVGNSGGQGRPALYFQIRREGQAVNPLPWLKN